MGIMMINGVRKTDRCYRNDSDNEICYFCAEQFSNSVIPDSYFYSQSAPVELKSDLVT